MGNSVVNRSVSVVFKYFLLLICSVATLPITPGDVYGHNISVSSMVVIPTSLTNFPFFFYLGSPYIQQFQENNKLEQTYCVRDVTFPTFVGFPTFKRFRLKIIILSCHYDIQHSCVISKPLTCN